jgi:hypothetical protein
MRRREERRSADGELLTAVNHQVNTTRRWHIARSEDASDAPVLERQMYDAMATQAAARATVELAGSEPVRDAAGDLAQAMVQGIDATADGSFLDPVRREQTVLMLCSAKTWTTKAPSDARLGRTHSAQTTKNKLIFLRVSRARVSQVR